jgi:hypothetical protein
VNSDFKPISCKRCGTVVWQGISWAGFARRLDTPVLTIEEEIIKRINKLMTFECHKTKVSFEAVERSANRIKWGKSKFSVILAEHHCSSLKLFEVTPPDYWAKLSTGKAMSQECVF